MKFFYYVPLVLLSCIVFSESLRAEDTPLVGNAPHGALLFSTRCGSCHGFDGSKVGPSMHGVFGRKAGAVADYQYSDALKSSTLVWNQNNLDKWLTNPPVLVPGTKMMTLVPQPQDRSDIVAYLKSLALPSFNNK